MLLKAEFSGCCLTESLVIIVLVYENGCIFSFCCDERGHQLGCLPLVSWRILVLPKALGKIWMIVSCSLVKETGTESGAFLSLYPRPSLDLSFSLLSFFCLELMTSSLS